MDLFSLRGKRALITGAGQGIGRATSLAMAAAGAEVIATDISEDGFTSLQDANNQIQVSRLDILDKNDIEVTAVRFGPVDVLFNCAGYVHSGNVLDCSLDDWNRSLAINVTGAYSMIKAFLPGMNANGGGSIINMSSVVSSVKGVPSRCAYSASKAAVIGLTKSVAADFIRQGIRCNALCPGTVESPSLQQRMRALGDYEGARQAFIARQPMGRFGQPEEISALVVYLASDASAYTTGHIHIIDGGWTA
jgi:2-keto-3-deoxy-L-fuconate dehydrogenase